MSTFESLTPVSMLPPMTKETLSMWFKVKGLELWRLPPMPKTNHEPFKVEEEGRGESQREMAREGLEAPLLALMVENGFH